MKYVIHTVAVADGLMRSHMYPCEEFDEEPTPAIVAANCIVGAGDHAGAEHEDWIQRDEWNATG